jgi:hypothetical protein
MMKPIPSCAACLGLCVVLLAGAGAEAQPTSQPAFKLPSDAPYVNVKNKGAKGDGVTDDTEAIRAAIKSTFNAWEVVYFPAGTYMVSDTISWGRFLTIRGEGPGRTVIKLADKATGYSQADKPKPVLFCRLGDWQSDPKKNNNTSHSNHIYHLTVDVGAGNPGAIGIDYSSHNGGTIKNVEVRAPEGSGYRGIAMDRNGPGPALVRDVTVTGFEYGLSTSWGLYSMTFENITLCGQRKAGFRNAQHNSTIRHLVSRNSVPAIENLKGRDYGLLVLLDSELKGAGGEAAAIESDGEIFVRNVKTSGYKLALRDGDKTMPGPVVDEYSSTPLVTPDGREGKSLNLPIKDPPAVPWEQDPAQWVSVRSFENLRKDGDWAPAIQAAIDSGKSTVYFTSVTHGVYACKSPVVIRGSVRRIVGNFARLQTRLLFESDHAVVLEQMRDCDVTVTGKGTLVLEGCLLKTVTTTPGCGELFIDDFLGTLDVRGSRVWVRQFNEETMRSPKITNEGGTLWILNLKTEQGGEILSNTKGARTELLGGMIYPAQGVQKQAKVMYRNDASSSLCVMHREIGSYPAAVMQGDKTLDLKFPRGVRFVARGDRPATAPSSSGVPTSRP